MPVSGLVVTLDSDPEAAARALLALGGDLRVTLGPSVGHRVAIALDTTDEGADREAWDTLRAIPGVVWIDLVSVTINPADISEGARSRRVRASEGAPS